MQPQLVRFLSIISLGLGLLPSLTAYASSNIAITVSSRIPWTDTGLDVIAGQFIQVSASGTVTVSSGGPPMTPDGAGCCSQNDPLPSTTHLSLIGKIVGNTEPTVVRPLVEGLVGKGPGFVGSSYRKQASHSGRLYIGFNDDYYPDNNGAFSVEITLSAPPEFLSHEYQMVEGNFSWHQAKADAERRGGHLATITSQAEFEYIQSLGVLGTSSGYWLGATDEALEGTWVWVTGEPMVFNRWQPGEPNNLGPEHYMVGHDSLSHNWNDVREDAQATVPYYLLEIDYCTPHKARATAQITNGRLVGATINDTGCGYTNAPLVLIRGGGGSGATATAIIADGRVLDILITDGGAGYLTAPRILIASPPFVPSVSIGVRTVDVVQNVVLGRRYVLEGSHDAKIWTEALPAFTAENESITNAFDILEAGRFFRVREVP